MVYRRTQVLQRLKYVVYDLNAAGIFGNKWAIKNKVQPLIGELLRLSTYKIAITCQILFPKNSPFIRY